MGRRSGAVRDPSGGADSAPVLSLEMDKSTLYPGRSGHFGITGYTHGPSIDLGPTLQRIAAGERGAIFQNREGLLPRQDAGYYTKHVVRRLA